MRTKETDNRLIEFYKLKADDFKKWLLVLKFISA